MLVTLGQFGAMATKAIDTHSDMHKTKVLALGRLLERRKPSTVVLAVPICVKRLCHSRAPVWRFTAKWL